MRSAIYRTLICCLLISMSYGWQVVFDPEHVQIHMKETKSVWLNVSNLDPSSSYTLRLTSDAEHLAEVNWQIEGNDIKTSDWSEQFNVTGLFLGRTNISAHLQRGVVNETSPVKLAVTVIRAERVIDQIFTISVALFVSLLYINFGAALDTSQLRGILTKPIGPIIGFSMQFVLMPLLSYGLGILLFPTSPELQIGLFFTGVSPAGGASNIWTVILNGNLNLSIVMTTISTFAAFGMMPLWIFTLGRQIFHRGDLGVPYSRISYFAFGLIIPLGIGLLIQRFFPRLAKLLVRVLKPVSTLLILFIIIFAIATNLYLFELFTWQIVVAGLGLPWIGYCCGWLAAKIFRQIPGDALAIAIETGIQNTGIAIFLLRFSLEQPAADLTTVIPVAVAIMTPFPLMGLYLIQKIRQRNTTPDRELLNPTNK